MALAAPIYMHVTWTLTPGSEPAFYNALKSLRTHIISEPECILFNVLADQREPGVIRIVEGFDASLDWLNTVGILFLALCCDFNYFY
jgi:quinol monooxygenase YgiN